MNNKTLGASIVILMLAGTVIGGVYEYNKGDKPLDAPSPAARTITPVDKTTSFTLVVLPDTQKYAADHPEIFCDQTRWIVENKEKLNIAFVSQLGDIVEHGGKLTKEWQTASTCMGLLDGNVPYGIIPGNHDSEIVGKNSSGFTSYSKAFPVSRFDSYPWYGGSFNNYENNYQIVTEGGVQLLFVNLSIEPSDDALAWADAVIKSHKDAYAIVTTHKYLPDFGSARDEEQEFSKDGNTGDQIWEKLIKPNCSIRMVLSGHFHTKGGENRITSKNSCGTRVDEITQDYQSREVGGNGKLRLYTFTPGEKKIRVTTYSPYTEKFEDDANSEFVIPMR